MPLARALLALCLGAFVACAARPPESTQAPTTPPPAPVTPTSTPDASVTPESDAGVTPDATASTDGAATSQDAGAESAACPAGMKLVDGDYCTDVDYKCQKSWYAKWNKKTVCERFEEKSSCVGEHVKKRYCIDTYEWPNAKGVRPEVMNRFHQAELKCAAVGKRMCTESEWNLACEGPSMKPYPYGYVRDSSKCNGDHKWDNPDMKKVARRDPDELARLWRGVPSGSQPDCISDYGVADMPGNTDEVVASEHYLEHNFTGKFDSVHTGGPWYEGVRNQCRPKVYTHDEGFYYYFLSFRCCAEADGKLTDWRTPRQRKDNWSLPKLERLAGFTLEDMKHKIDLKKQGKCTCGAKDTLCKTLCGTLLGPGAKDAVVGEHRGEFGSNAPGAHK
jgi:Sulfatase-modifying factor enzyme 1